MPGKNWFSPIKRATPGIIAGSADLDPAAVLTATVVGAAFGLNIAWVILLCIPVLIAVFGVAARVGQETKQGLVELVRNRYGRRIAAGIALLVVGVNIAMIIADLIAVSEGVSIILRQPSEYFPPIVAFAVWYLLTMSGYERASRAMAWVSIVLFAYIAAAVLSTDSPGRLAAQVLLPEIPSNPAYVLGVVALFGSLLTPDILVWQTSSRRDIAADFHHSESRVACVVASLVSLSAVICASRMAVSGNPEVMTTRMAAQALAPLGELGPLLFAVGIVGSGLIALPILVASMCFSIAEAAGWPSGLRRPVWEAPRFFILIAVVLIAAVLVNLAGINTVKALYWSQILAGVVVVPILLTILLLSNDRTLMQSPNTRWQNFWLGGAVGGMFMANIVYLYLVATR